MKTLVTIIITFILTTVIIIGGGALYIAKENPYNIQACIISSFLNPGEGDESSVNNTAEKTSDYDHPLLSDDQEKMLENLGLDVSTLPASISPEMKACAIEKLGEKRVQEILDGDTPGALEIFKAKDCL